MRYYNINPILKKNARYNIVFGERSNGKTYAVQEYALKDFLKTGKQLAVVRRWREDFRGKRGQAYFENLAHNGNEENVILRLSKGKYDRIIYNASKWYLAYWDDDLQKNILNEKPFAYAFAITEMEHDKGNSYPDINTVLFDEFMTRSAYLPDEFVLFMNTLSTIIRHRNNVKVFMCANTVSKYCPYFKEMGLKHVTKMKKGDIDVYKYGDSGLTVAVEFADSPNIMKPSDVYFAFDNPKLQMITNGIWELDIYPHITEKINEDDIIFSYFIMFDDNLLQADIVVTNNSIFTFIHKKTTPIKKPDEDIIFSTTPQTGYNYHVNMLIPRNEIAKKIYMFFKGNKVFYQSNEIGEIVSNYLAYCRTNKV